MMNTQKEIQCIRKEVNKMNNTNQVYDRMVGAGRKILETDLINGTSQQVFLWLI